MFNTKLSTVQNMRKLRICVLVSVRPSGSVVPLSASLFMWARGTARWSFWTRCSICHVPASGPRINLTLVTQAGGTLSLLSFHKVHPVIRSNSPAIIWESCAQNAGLPSAFLAVIIRAGVAAPLPLLPPLLLPLPGRLGNVVAHNLHPPEGTLRYISGD